MNWRRVLVAVVLLVFVADGSDAFLLSNIQKLVGRRELVDEISPSPGPISSAKGSSGTASGPVPSKPPKAEAGDSNISDCKGVSMECHNQNMNACVIRSASVGGNDIKGEIFGCHVDWESRNESTPMEVFLLVHNDGESALEVNVTVSPVTNSRKAIQLQKFKILKHQVERINISEYVGSPLIVALNGDCFIHIGSPPQTDTSIFDQLHFYGSQVTPIHGVYLLSLTALLIGGTWACCKLGKKGRQADGVPYQELEMGHPNSHSTVNVETAEGWDRGWDDDWDEENAVKPPGENNVANRSANGHASKPSNGDGWEVDWDD